MSLGQELAPHLPFLRRYARALTGSQSHGDAFVRANGGRPVSLQRFPAGVDGDDYFSKNPPKGAPEYVRSVEVTYPSGRSHPQLVIDEPAAAVWAAQMNTVVFHPWASRADASDLPDQLRIDLDPQPGTDVGDVPGVLVRVRTPGSGPAGGVREQPVDRVVGIAGSPAGVLLRERADGEGPGRVESHGPTMPDVGRCGRTPHARHPGGHGG